MSCWCDGDDPGCKVCHPNMLPEAREAFRADKQAVTALLALALREDVAAYDLILAAKAWRDARKTKNTFDVFGQAKVAP